MKTLLLAILLTISSTISAQEIACHTDLHAPGLQSAGFIIKEDNLTNLYNQIHESALHNLTVGTRYVVRFHFVGGTIVSGAWYTDDAMQIEAKSKLSLNNTCIFAGIYEV